MLSSLKSGQNIEILYAECKVELVAHTKLKKKKMGVHDYFKVLTRIPSLTLRSTVISELLCVRFAY